jgi:hypothetical protein
METKNSVGNFLNYQITSQIKCKKLRISKKLLQLFLKGGTSLHIKTYSKMIYFFKIWFLNYLPKFVEQHFSKTHFDASESTKTLFFVTSPKLKILMDGL